MLVQKLHQITRFKKVFIGTCTGSGIAKHSWSCWACSTSLQLATTAKHCGRELMQQIIITLRFLIQSVLLKWTAWQESIALASSSILDQKIAFPLWKQMKSLIKIQGFNLFSIVPVHCRRRLLALGCSKCCICLGQQSQAKMKLYGWVLLGADFQNTSHHLPASLDCTVAAINSARAKVMLKFEGYKLLIAIIQCHPMYGKGFNSVAEFNLCWYLGWKSQSLSKEP